MSELSNAIVEAAACAAELHAHKTTIALGAGGLVLEPLRVGEPAAELVERFTREQPAIVALLGVMVPIKLNRVGEPTGVGWKRWVLS
ncbi:MAG TPA: hypothetical protein VGI10_22715 [Polyangiaceae bacterium]|jgi:hypothetical protein